MKKTRADLATLVGKYVRAIEVGKRAYKRSDCALDAIVKAMKVGQTVTLKNGKTFQLIDLFASASAIFKPCGVRRFKLEEIAEP